MTNMSNDKPLFQFISTKYFVESPTVREFLPEGFIGQQVPSRTPEERALSRRILRDTVTLSLLSGKKAGSRILEEAGLYLHQNEKRIPHCICRDAGIPYA